MKQGIFLRKMEAGSKDIIIDVVGVIGWEVWYTQMREMLRAIPEDAGRVVFEIYSPGGDVWEGNAIVNEIGALKQHTVARVQVAASMATSIAVACKEREIAANGRWLIHNPWTQLQGDAATLEKRAKELRDCEREAAEFYAARTGQTVEKMRELMAEERWLTANEAKALGFVQKIDDPFEPDCYESVRREIVAAGKWPQSLAEIQDNPDPAPVPPVAPDAPDEKTEKEASHEDAAAAGPTGNVGSEPVPAAKPVDGAAAVPAEPTQTPDELADALLAADSAGYERARVECEEQRATELAALTRQVEARDKLVSEMQSARDKALARTAALEQQHAAKLADTIKDADVRLADLRRQHDAALAERNVRIAELTAKLEDANARNAKLLGGGMTFEPAPCETWEEAMQLCQGNYVEAARRFPKLRDEYNRKHARK